MKKTLVYAALVVAAFFAATVPAISSESDTAELSQKLDKVIKTQEKILADLVEIKAELKIVKVRATMK